MACSADDVGLVAERTKDIPGDYRITNKIVEMIESARFLVADLTLERPNVYFELGYARGLGKTVITIARTGEEIHFDVKDWNMIYYENAGQKLQQALSKAFRYELGQSVGAH